MCQKKLTPTFIKKMKKVLGRPATMFHSHKELLFLINKELGEERAMSFSRFTKLNSILRKPMEDREKQKPLNKVERDFLNLIDGAKSLALEKIVGRIWDGKKSKEAMFLGERFADRLNLKHKVESKTEVCMKDVLDNIGK
jgi:hypothetical protein